MTLKLISTLIVFVLLIVYFTFLNPSDVEVYFTQHFSLKMPIVVFMLGSILVGVVCTALATGLQQFRNSLRQYGRQRVVRKQEKLHRKWEELFQKAINEITSGQRAKGIALLEKILNQAPEHFEALAHLGDQLREEGDPERAVTMHQRAIKLDPDNLPVRFALAKDYAALGNVENEIATLKEIRSRNPNSLPTLRQLRDAFLKAGNPDQAYQMQKAVMPLIHDARELAQEQELFSQITYSKGYQLYQEKKIEPAIVELKRALRENNRCLPAYLTLGQLYLENNNPKTAIKFWKDGFDITQSPIFLIRLQNLYEDMDKVHDSYKLYQEAISKASSDNRRELFSMLYVHHLFHHEEKDTAMEVLNNIEHPSLSTQMYKIKALLDRNDYAQVDEIMHATHNRLSIAIEQYICSACHHKGNAWYAFCPECHAWNTLQLQVEISL
ncbi:conserved hypothetical protein, contains TPR repeats [Nitrospina gracilis 3/211]|uniref:Uncharacterized protein n=1 Tax=Nitrospina gracilis (strain 3/211) TaxID=1266370 RepID=M1YY75_NITG3|nr:tetratricopeptide repeat protein [Nitrospina gracilis]MCF8723161.1 lipopolysaccharide biosynthesis regulator YciM [Nitrospina sp. Nb-3]CCQ90204.1 conserved hypothetical protein, contains TPR repeats [Nitrospina gracilis 3/211]